MMKLVARIKKQIPRVLLLLLCAAPAGCATTRTTQPEAATTSYDAPLPDAWFAVWSPLGDPPLIEFTFPAPQDIYVGEIHRATGHLRFGKGLTFDRARGKFSLYVHAVEMGEDDLTLNVQNAIDMLSARRFPKIYYEIRSITSNAEKISFGEQTPVTLHGLFKLKGITFPLDVNATVLITLNEKAQPTMMLAGSFTLKNLKARFDISGPGDPEEEASSTVIIKFRFPLLTEEASKAIKAKELSERRPFSEPE